MCFQGKGCSELFSAFIVQILDMAYYYVCKFVGLRTVNHFAFGCLCSDPSSFLFGRSWKPGLCVWMQTVHVANRNIHAPYIHSIFVSLECFTGTLYSSVNYSRVYFIFWYPLCALLLSYDINTRNVTSSTIQFWAYCLTYCSICMSCYFEMY